MVNTISNDISRTFGQIRLRVCVETFFLYKEIIARLQHYSKNFQYPACMRYLQFNTYLLCHIWKSLPDNLVAAFQIMIKYRYIRLSYFPKYLIWNELKARNICLMCSKLTLNSYVSANSNTNALFACFKSSLNGLTSTNTQWKFVYKMVFLIERSYYWNPFLTPLHNLAKGTKETGKI